MINMQKAYTKVSNMWINAQLKGKNHFDVKMKNGTAFKIVHYKSSPMNPTWGSFSIFDIKHHLIANEVSNTDDLAEILVKLGTR